MFFLEFILKSAYRNGLIDYGSGIVKKKNPNSLDLFRTGIIFGNGRFLRKAFHERRDAAGSKGFKLSKVSTNRLYNIAC